MRQAYDYWQDQPGNYPFRGTEPFARLPRTRAWGREASPLLHQAGVRYKALKALKKSKPTHHARGTRPVKALVPPNADASTLFPVLTSFRSNLPLQRIWDHGLQRGLPSKRGLVNRGPIPRRIPKRLHAQQVWPSASNPHPFQRRGRSSQKEGHPTSMSPTDARSVDSPSPFPSQASTPRQTGTSMARTRTGQPTLSPHTSTLEAYGCQGTFLPQEPTDFTHPP